MSLSTASPSARTSLTALAEVLGIYIAGQVLMIILIKLLGLEISNPLLTITNQTTPADLIPISIATAKILAVQNIAVGLFSFWLSPGGAKVLPPVNMAYRWGNIPFFIWSRPGWFFLPLPTFPPKGWNWLTIITL